MLVTTFIHIMQEKKIKESKARDKRNSRLAKEKDEHKIFFSQAFSLLIEIWFLSLTFRLLYLVLISHLTHKNFLHKPSKAATLFYDKNYDIIPLDLNP